jgi:hypothetical protein
MTTGNLKLIALFSIALSTATAWAQILSPDAKANVQPATGSSPVAYVYVASAPPNSNTNQIVAYTAAANGSLSPMPGSPFPENVYSMAVNGKYLMAANRATPDINAYNIASDGALSFSASTNYAQYNAPGGCGGAGQVFLDHTGATLYIQEFNGSDSCSNTVVASFSVVKATGSLTFLGTDVTGAFPGFNSAAYFIGNNVYAYGAVNSACMYFAIYGFKRAENGMLNGFEVQANQPTLPPGIRGYVRALAAADPTNHVAFTMQPANPPGCAPGPLQLASYTADSNGDLTTTNTYANMPATSIVNYYDMKMSPSGKLLAIAGQEGLQVFHFRGELPIKHYTGLLTHDPINQMFWDNNNHLYAISGTSGKLFVFTITPTQHARAPGSPYPISTPVNVIVQPLPLFGK